MPRKKKDRNYYYGVDQEIAVVQFLEASTVAEKEKIYRTHLMEPINTMIESIIRTYKLYRKSYQFEDIHADALGFLMTKFDKFDPTTGNKSFSYFGTICRNYLFGEMIKEHKKNTKMVEMEMVAPDIMNREELTYRIDEETLDLTVFIQKLIDELRTEVAGKNLSDNEFMVGHSLIKILENWKILFIDPEDESKNSTKFNKNLILLYIRNLTGLTTKEIRNSMKRFKTLYFVFKNDYLDD